MKNNALYIAVLVGGAALIFFGMNAQKPLETPKISAEAHQHEEGHGEEIIPWNKARTEAANLKTAIAGPGIIQNVIQASGKILIHPDLIAYIIPKVGGTVKEILKNQGDTVSEGEILAVLESKEMAEAKSTYLAAVKKLALKQTLLEREEGLKEISPEQDFLNAKAAVEEGKIDEDLAQQNLFTLGLSQEAINNILQEDPTQMRFYKMHAPFAGRVIQRDLTLGERVTSDLKAFTIGNFSKTWAEISVNPADLAFLKEGENIEIRDQEGHSIKTKIAHFNPLINEDTRTVTVVAILDNNSGNWMPGKFISADISRQGIEVPLSVNKNAVQQVKGDQIIFLQEGENFVPRKVKLGRADETHVEVLSGLKSGDKYASENTFLLKAEYEKEEAEHTH